MIRTIFFFGGAGIWTACFSNGLRRLPIFRKPQTHVLFTTIGLLVGYRVHLYEENAEQRYEKMLAMRPYVTRLVKDVPGQQDEDHQDS